MKRLVLFLSSFIVFATSSFLFGDISKYVTSADINSIAFEYTENYAKLVSMPISEKQKIISLIQEIDQLGLEKIFIQNMAKNNFAGTERLKQANMLNILQNFNPELANYFDIVSPLAKTKLACSEEDMGEEARKIRKAEQAWLIRNLEKEFNRGLEDLYLMKKEMDETKFLSFVSNISQFPSPFNEPSFWNLENIEKYWYEIMLDARAVSSLVKPNQFLDISILEKPLSTYFFQNTELELIKISTSSNQPLTTDRQEKFSFSKILPYFYEDSELETMKRQNTRLLENVLGTYSNYFEISDQIPLFNLEQEKEQTNLSTGRESPDEFPVADCKKNFEYELRLQRDVELLKIRAKIFNEIKKYYREFDSDFIALQRQLPPLLERILNSIEVHIRVNNNHLYGYSDYQVLLSNTKRLRDNITDSKRSFDEIITVLQFLEKLSASKHQVKISNKNIIVNGEIISADILHIGDLSYFRSSNNQLYGYFNNGQWNILDQYESSVEKAFQTFENNKAPNFESIIIPAPKAYVSAAKVFFTSALEYMPDGPFKDKVIEDQKKKMNDQFKYKVIGDQRRSYCGDLYKVAINYFDQNSISMRAQRSNEVILGLYENAQRDNDIDRMSKIAELAAKGYDFSGFDITSYQATKSASTSAINRLANVAWSNNYLDRHGGMLGHNFAYTIESICNHGEDFRRSLN